MIRYSPLLLLIVLLQNQTAVAQSFEWATGITGQGSDLAVDVIADEFGNAYTIGTFEDSVDLDPGAGTLMAGSNNGSRDVFIQKLDSQGNLLWAKTFGGTSTENVYSITLDALGNSYITGTWQDTADFDPGSGVFEMVSAYNLGFLLSRFIVKLDVSGSFVWAKRLGGTLGEPSLFIDSEGNLIATGQHQGDGDFDPDTLSSFTLSTSNNAVRNFVQKISADGEFIWANLYGGGANSLELYGSAVDNENNIILTGTFRDSMVVGVNQFIYAEGIDDVYIQKIDENGDVVWGYQYGGFNTFSFEDTRPYDIVTDNEGNIITSGGLDFSAPVDFDPDPTVDYMLTPEGGSIYYQKLNSFGNHIWTKLAELVSNGSSTGPYIATDEVGNIYSAGNVAGPTEFYTDNDTITITVGGVIGSTFVAKMNPNGVFEWVRGDDDGQDPQPQGIAIDNNDNVFVTGLFFGVNPVDFNPGTGEFNLSVVGGTESYVQKFGVCNPITQEDLQIACSSFTWIDGNTYTESNNTASFTYIGNSYYGCDSTVNLNLTITGPATGVDVQAACESFTWIDGNTYTESDNEATFVIQNGASTGCDSIVTLNLTVTPEPNPTIQQNGITLECPIGFDSYQWYDDNGPIPNAISSNYTPTTTGNFYCVVEQNSCFGQSNTIMYIATGLISKTDSDILIYPNPVTDFLKIQIMEKEVSSIQMYDLSGKEIVLKMTNSGMFDVSHVKSGVYIVAITFAENRFYSRIVKQ